MTRSKLSSVKLSMIQDYETGLENVSNRLSYALEVVNYDKTWDDISNYPEVPNRLLLPMQICSSSFVPKVTVVKD